MNLLRRLPLALLALPIFLAGCGGGGGNPPSQSKVLVTTDWSSDATAAAAPKSERISIVKADGTVASSVTVNESLPKTLTSLTAPTGSYTVHIELNSAPDFGGVVTGVLDAASTGGASTIQVSAGAAVDTVRVLPVTSDISVGQTVQLGMVGIAADGQYTFLLPNQTTFSTTGTAATVSAAGKVVGVANGSVTVTGVYAPLAKTANAVVNVQDAGLRHGKWTVMVFLNASNDLYPYAVPNVDQMEKVAYNPDVRFVVQWKESKTQGSDVDFDGTRRYLVKYDTTSGVKSQLVQDMGTGVDMGKVDTLRDFVSWAQQKYPADHYALIVWNHGNGWQRKIKTTVSSRAVSYDDQTGSFIDIWDLPKALTGTHVDIFSFDACVMQMLEIASEIKGTCDYIASSEENTPALGYPYDRVFKGFADNADDSPRALSKNFVTGHVGNPSYQSLRITQSVIDTTKLGDVETAIDALAGALIANRAGLTTAVPALRNSMGKYADANDGRYYYDLVDMAQKIQASSSFPADVKAAAAQVEAATTNSVVWEGHTASRAFSHGLAIDFSPSTLPELSIYGNLNLAKVTRWGQWLNQAP